MIQHKYLPVAHRGCHVSDADEPEAKRGMCLAQMLLAADVHDSVTMIEAGDVLALGLAVQYLRREVRRRDETLNNVRLALDGAKVEQPMVAEWIE